MFLPIEGGTKEIISNGDDYDYVCWVPPLGYGINSATGKLEKTDVIKRSNKKSDQYWERTDYPFELKEWNRRRESERHRQKSDSSYYDADLLKFEQQEWRRRLCGAWFYNNGKPVYVTGNHYMLMNWWKFQGKYFKFRDTNRKFYYIWDYCVEDPNCLGLVEFTKRKEGKTARGGQILYEYTSRTSNKHAGIQSKTDDDASEVFQKAIVSPWKKLPDFFRPRYDITLGDNPKGELRFFKPSQKGKKALEISDEEDDELESWIDYASSGVDAYDGPELHRYLSDESGKLKNISIVERHNTVMFCSEVDGEFVGKHLYTTTVELMESGGGEFMELVKMSNPNKRDKNGRTASGLYTYFLPAYETIYAKDDKYGYPDIEKGKEYFLNRRESLQATPRSLSSFIRKNPFTVAEAFRIDGEKSLYNSEKLNNRREYLSWHEEILERGNFEWEGGVRDSKVIWVKTKNGRWSIPRGFHFENVEDTNKVIHRGNQYFPGNKLKFISGIDPYDHDNTEDDRKASKAVMYTRKKHDPFKANDPFNKAFICRYSARPAMAKMMYEDAIMQCVYFGSPIIYESNKPGIKRYFEERGYGEFLVQLPDYKDPGIPSTPDNKQTLVELTEVHIEEDIERVYYIDLIDDWLKFDVKDTQKYDDAMAAGWTLVADMHILARKEISEIREITDYFEMVKIV